MKRFIFAVALAGTAAAGVAAAQSATTPAQPRHRMIAPDANKDGITTRAEVLAAADARFAALDANKDGKLSASERPGRRFGRTDAARIAGDVTRDQFRQAALTRFDAKDANKDGRIDQAERTAVRDRRAAGRHQGRGGPEGGIAKHGSRGMAGRTLKMADANKDGIITKAEFTAGAVQAFARLDANGDGRIDQAERQTARARLKGRRSDDIGPPPSGY